MQIEQESSTSAASPSGAGAASAPGVVATIVVSQPAPHLTELLQSLADQDYPNLQVMVLVTGDDEAHLATTVEAARSIVADAHIRQLGGNPGFGPAANAVLRLVEGDSGFFLFLHDDVALDRGAVSAMVEEVYRSNAGIVGPKLVDWDDPRILRTVGLASDRFGVLESEIEPGEIDQEQHDAVRDVFVVPSACLLVRADLFRSLGGFEPSIDFHGEDVDLCWRAHASGARVVVVPAARVRHVSRIGERRPDLRHQAKGENHRATTVAVMTGGLRLPFTIIAMIVGAIASSIILVARGRPGDARVRIGAIASMLANLPRIIGRRRRVAGLRHVPDREVGELLLRGSVRWRRWWRSRRIAGSVKGVIGGGGDPVVVRESTDRVTAWTFLGLAVVFLLGTRDIVFGRLARLGDFLPIDGPRALLSDVVSGWWGQGLGSSTPHPTSHLLLSFLGFVSLGHPALVATALSVGLIPVGWWGVARVCGVMNGVVADSRLRAVGPVAYAAIPLPYTAVATGRLSVLVGYATLPWVLYLVTRFSDGTETSGGESVTALRRRRRRALTGLAVLMGAVIAFAPDAALVMVVVVIVSGLLASIVAPSRDVVWGAGALVVATVGGVLLNLPWITRFLESDGWSALVGADAAPSDGPAFLTLARFGVAPVALGGLVLALYLPTLVAPLVARDRRLVSATRAALLVGIGLLLAALASGGHAPFALPETGVLLIPVATGLALGAASMARVFLDDVRGGSFGWRQPLSILAIAAVPLGVLPAVAVSLDGSYDQPSVTFADQMSELLDDRSSGDFRVIVLGDPAKVPGAARRYSDGVAYSIVNNGAAGFTDGQPAPVDDDRRFIVPVLDALSTRTTDRVGRLSAPLGVRYFVVPLDGNVPDGLIAALATQLDLRRVYSPASMAVFENSQYIPVTAMLSAIASASSTSGGDDAIAQSDLTGSIGVLAGASRADTVSQVLPEGTLHLGVPFDSRWRVEFEGSELTARASFGSVMAFEVPSEGRVDLSYRASGWRYPVLVGQILAWVLAVLIVVRPGRRRSTVDTGSAAQRSIDEVEAPLVVLGSATSPTPDDDKVGGV